MTRHADGTATGGSSGQPLQFDLPGGGRARICAKWDTCPDGRDVGKGIAPQIEIMPSVTDVRQHQDSMVERAVAALYDPSVH